MSLPACFPDTCISVSFYFLFSSLSASPHFYDFSWSLTLLSSYHVFRCMFVPSCNTDSCLHLRVLKPTCHTQAWGGKFHFQQFFERCERTSECLSILGNRTLVSEPSGFLTLCLWNTGKGEAPTLAVEAQCWVQPLFRGKQNNGPVFLLSLSRHLALKFLSFSLFPP